MSIFSDWKVKTSNKKNHVRCIFRIFSIQVLLSDRRSILLLIIFCVFCYFSVHSMILPIFARFMVQDWTLYGKPSLWSAIVIYASFSKSFSFLSDIDNIFVVFSTLILMVLYFSVVRFFICFDYVFFQFILFRDLSAHTNILFFIWLTVFAVFFLLVCTGLKYAVAVKENKIKIYSTSVMISSLTL